MINLRGIADIDTWTIDHKGVGLVEDLAESNHASAHASPKLARKPVTQVNQTAVDASDTFRREIVACTIEFNEAGLGSAVPEKLASL